MERLQKVMAAAGVDSRRACERLIESGRVQVDGRIVTELGTKVDPKTARIQVDGQDIEGAATHTYIKLYKPTNILSDIGGDTRDRQTVADLLPPEVGRVFPVGRLDFQSEGLILLTDDGELANRLTHPRYEHPKIYYVLVAQHPSYRALNQLRNGVDITSGRTAPARVEVVERLPDELVLDTGGAKAGVWLKMTLREGKKRQIRHMTGSVGHPTLRLIRWTIGPLMLGKLRPKESAYLTKHELTLLRELTRAKLGNKRPKDGKENRTQIRR